MDSRAPLENAHMIHQETPGLTEKFVVKQAAEECRGLLRRFVRPATGFAVKATMTPSKLESPRRWVCPYRTVSFRTAHQNRVFDSVLADWGLALSFLWMNKALRSLSKVLFPQLDARENLGLWPQQVGTDKREFEFPSQQSWRSSGESERI